MIVVAVCAYYLRYNLWKKPTKIDASLTVMNKNAPTIAVFGFIIIAMFVLPLNENSW